MSLHVGEAVGDYRVIGIIGAGGMGQVFQVEHKITKRKEAMKVLIADLADDTQMQRFKREIEVQARLNHPNIATVHNAFRLKDRLMLVLEFVEGQTLETILKRGRLPLATGLDYFRQILEALSYAHEAGVVHRDVSPANLMITDGGLVKLMDFGVAKSLGDLRLTDNGSMIGSLNYMSPEQVKGSTEPDPRSDIYSAGAVLYEIATGKKPFDYEDRFSLMVAQVEEQPRLPSLVNPELPVELDSIILKALAKDPTQRYSSAKHFTAALAPLKRAPVTKVAPAPVISKRGVVTEIVAGASIVFICGITAAGAMIWNRLNEPIPAPGVNVSLPAAPQNLAGIPPAPPAVAPQPETLEEPSQAPALQQRTRARTTAVRTTHVPSQTVLATKMIAKQASAAKGKTEGEVSQGNALESKPAEAQQADVAPAEPPHTDTQPATEEEPGAQPAQSKKGHFWSRLNPFHKKKKMDSALHSGGEAPAVGH